MAKNSITVSVIADTRRARQGLNDVSGGFSRLSSTAAKAGRAVAAGLAVGVVAAVGLGAASVKAASDAQQSLGATQTVFGKYASSVIENSNKAARAVGISANEYRELSNVTGALLAGAGMPLKRVAGLTDDLNKRAADMAATFGGTTKDAVEAISSLMKGEADPIEKYGVSIKDSDISARLAAQGLDKLTGSALKQAQMQARLELLMSKTSKTQGAFKRESNTLANQQQVLAAQFEDIKAKIGTALLPALTRLATFVNDKIIPAFVRMAPAAKEAFANVKEAIKTVADQFKAAGAFISQNAETFKVVGAAIAGIAGTFLLIAAAVKVWTIAQIALNVVLTANPIGILVVAIGALVGAMIYLYRNNETVRTAMQRLFGWLRTNVGPILTNLGALFRAVFSVIRTVVVTNVAIIKRVWAVFGPTLVAFARASFNNIKNIIQGVLKVIAGVIKVVTSVIKGDWRGALNGLKSIASGAWQAIKGVFSQGGNLIKTAVKLAITGVVTLFRGLKGKVTGALSGIGTWLLSAGQDLIRGMINGVKNMAGGLVDAAKGVVGGAIKGAKSLLGIKSPSRVFKVIGEQTIAGFILGIRKGRKGALSAVSDLLERVSKAAGKKANMAKAISAIKDERKALANLGTAYEKVTKRLSAANKRLADLKKQRADYAAGVTNSALGLGNITSLNTAFTTDAMAEQLAARIKQLKDFSALINTLKSRGLNKTMLNDLIQAGAEGGFATAQALAAGGPEAIKQFDALQTDLSKTAKSLGDSTAAHMYNAGINAAQGLVNGLNKRAKALESAAKRLAVAMVKQIKAALGIKSPSRVFRDLGLQTVKGLEIGLSETRKVAKASAALGTTVEKSFQTPTLNTTATSFGHGSNAGSTVININVNGSVIDGAVEGQKIASYLDAYYKQGGRRLAL